MRNDDSGRKKKILVVDDEPSVCAGIEYILKPAGYDVVQTYSGEDAVKKVEAEDYDLVLMDLVMPGLDGSDACAKIKSMKPYIRVLAISGSPTGQSLEKFLRSGGIELYLYKPFGKQELIEAVEKAFRGEYIHFREDT